MGKSVGGAIKSVTDTVAKVVAPVPVVGNFVGGIAKTAGNLVTDPSKIRGDDLLDIGTGGFAGATKEFLKGDPATVGAVAIGGGAAFSPILGGVLGKVVDTGKAAGKNLLEAGKFAAEVIGDVAGKAGPLLERARGVRLPRGGSDAGDASAPRAEARDFQIPAALLDAVALLRGGNAPAAPQVLRGPGEPVFISPQLAGAPAAAGRGPGAAVWIAGAIVVLGVLWWMNRKRR